MASIHTWMSYLPSFPGSSSCLPSSDVACKYTPSKLTGDKQLRASNGRRSLSAVGSVGMRDGPYCLISALSAASLVEKLHAFYTVQPSISLGTSGSIILWILGPINASPFAAGLESSCLDQFTNLNCQISQVWTHDVSGIKTGRKISKTWSQRQSPAKCTHHSILPRHTWTIYADFAWNFVRRCAA